MKLLKFINSSAIILCLIIPFFATAQEKEEKFFYKDTIFEYNGSKIEITRSVSTKIYFKSVVAITNQSEDFIIVNPWDIFGFVTGSNDKYTAVAKRPIVIAPKYTKKITVKFEGRDFREPSLTFDFTKLQVTEKIESVYEFNDIDLSKENFRSVGPIKWTMLEKKADKEKAIFRVETQVEYSGTKFLGIFYNNITLKTKDGSTFINASKKSGDFHYDKEKPFKRIVLIFPVEADKVKNENEPKLNYSGVFKEYSIATIVGFKVHLRSGTLEDYKGKKGDDKDKDIEEIE